MRSARSFARGARTIIALAAAVAALGAIGASPAAPADSGLTNPKHFFWGQTTPPSSDALTNDIIYHGGSAGPGAIGVEIKPAVYLIYWGPEWATGFSVTDVIGVLERPWPVCRVVRASVSNVVVDGTTCSASDANGPVDLDPRGRPTADSTLVIDAASRRYAPKTDITGRRRGARPDVGAYEYPGR